MPKIQGAAFENSDTCRGVAFAPEGAPLDFAEIEIQGRYPENGWALNKLSHEIVTIKRGMGSLALLNEGVVGLEEGTVVHIPPETWFRWEGDMTIGMACSPPFNLDQYKVVEFDEVSDELLLRVHQVADRYFPEDKLFIEIEGMDEEDILNFLYGQLLEIGEDPDLIFSEFGITEDSEKGDEQ